MTISVKCKSCGKVLKAKESAAGKKAKCPDCGAVIAIPELDELYDAEEMKEEPVEDDEMDFGDAEASMPKTQSRKPCPACGEMIVKGAAKCRYCGEILDPALKKLEKKKNRASRRSYSAADEDLTGFDWFLCLFCSGIGCIVGIIRMIQGNPSGGKMFGISFCMVIFWNIVNVALQMAAQR